MTKWNGIIGHTSSNSELACNGVIREVISDRTIDHKTLFNAEITQLILQSRPIATTDASAKDGELGGAWIIMSSHRNEALSNTLHHKE